MAIVVLDHRHLENVGVYRMVVGEEVVDTVLVEVKEIPGEKRSLPKRALMKMLRVDPVPPPIREAVHEDRVVGYVNVHEVDWSDDDPQWFRGGERIPDEEAVEVQRGILKARVKDLLAEQKALAGAPSRELPGVGQPLL